MPHSGAEPAVKTAPVPHSGAEPAVKTAPVPVPVKKKQICLADERSRQLAALEKEKQEFVSVKDLAPVVEGEPGKIGGCGARWCES